MFIAIIGPRLSGKTTVKEYLIKSRGFVPVRLAKSDNYHGPLRSGKSETYRLARPESFLLMHSPTTPSFPSATGGPHFPDTDDLLFRSPADLLNYATQNWRSDFVTTDLDTIDLLEPFKTRPFFLIISVDAPIFTRYQRSIRMGGHSERALRDFVQEHDDHFYGAMDFRASDGPKHTARNLSIRRDMVDVHIMNAFETIDILYDYLDDLNLTDIERLRPGWDTYFMQLASLASLRSNCMKRRVGAILVRNKRILATGYNGTPRGLTNCNEGGCTRCNSASETPDECVCLHAEENALLEAGRDRVGDGAVLYCNTCPCLKCTIKIIQTGVKEVVYNLSYKVDDASAALFKEAGVILRRHAPPPDA